MFSTVSHYYNVLMFLDLSLAVLCCILLVKVPRTYAIKFLTIPIIVFTTFMLVVEGEEMLGRPFELIPVGDFEFIDYRVSKSGVELWILQNDKSRLHVVPHNEGLVTALSKMRTLRRQGKRIEGNLWDGESLSPNFSVVEESTGKEDIPAEPPAPRPYSEYR